MNKPQKNLLLTFDYELFLGRRSGVPENCLILPTETLVRIFDEFRIKAVFFVDTIYLLRLVENRKKNNGQINDFEKIKTQLQEIVRKGHYVFPHIHPHWLDASYDPRSNEWSLNNVSKYRFHNISEQERSNLFDSSIHLLNEIVHPVNPEYKVNGYRAGGWSLQPFDDFRSHFIKHGIAYEFSVLGGFYVFSPVQHFDYTSIPPKMIYRFEEDVTRENPSGRFVEFVNSTMRVKPYVNIIDRVGLKVLYKMYGDHSYGRGEGQRSTLKYATIMEDTGETGLKNNYEYVSLELLTMVKLPSYLGYFRENNYMQFVSHPKMLTHHNMQMLRTFLKRVMAQYSVETDFIKMVPEKAG